VVFIVRRLLILLPVWTMRHGHFLIMGGFHLVEPLERNSTSQEAAGTLRPVVDTQIKSTPSVKETKTDAERGLARPSGNTPERKEGRVTILTLEMLQELVKDPNFEIRITEKEIADRSKGDALAKTILILQVSWFIFQCIMRRVQGLSLTQLELTTLALASLSGITSILWWDKPLGVEVPVRVYINRPLKDAERALEKGRVSDLFKI